MKEQLQANIKLVLKTTMLLLLFNPILSYGQALTGAKTIPGTYVSLQAAIADLNTNGVGAGGVVFNISAGYTETAPVGGDSITVSGTAANRIVFQKDPSTSGANPLITAQVGTGTLDGVLFIMGGSYITIDGIDLQDNAANTTTATQMEWGYAFVKRSNVAPFIGCQHDTIKNCTITLNRTNASSRGIYANNHTKYSTTALAMTTNAEAHSYNGFVNNTIQNVNSGIYISGFAAAAAPYSLWDQSNYIYGNTVVNFAGAAAGNGIYNYYQSYNTISFNTIDNYNNGTASAIGASVSTVYGIYNVGTTSGANPGNATINNNTVKLTAATGTSCTMYGIYDYYAGGAVVVNNNSIKFATLGTTACTGTYYATYVYPTSYATSIQYKNNHIDSVTYNNSTGSFYGHYVYGTASTTTDISGNTILNFTKNLASSGTFYGFYTYGSNAYTSSNSVFNFNNNIIDSVNLTTNTGSVYVTYYVSGGYTTNIYNNSFTRVYSTAGTGSMYGMYPYYYATNVNIYNNTVSNLYYAGTLYGIYYYGYYFADGKIYNNTISNLTATGASSSLVGFYTYYAGTNSYSFYKNKIYSLLATGSGGCAAQGTLIFQASYQAVPKMPVKIYNNFFSDIQAPTSTNSGPCVTGININYSSYTYSAYASYNTINLTGNGGPNSNSSCVFVANAIPTLAMNNNILVNKTIHTGTGIASAYQRVSTALSTYDYTSNNNLFYSGIPSSKNLYYYDGTNKDSVFSSFKLRMSPRENASATEDITFISTSPTSANYLQPDSTIATGIESGAQNIVGITDDYNGKIRKGNAGYTGNPLASAPDLGAIEGNYTPFPMAYDSCNADQYLIPVLKGKTNQVVLRMRVITENSYAALSVTRFKMNTAGTTTIGDISNAKIFYTAGGATFSSANQFGSVVAAPNGTFYVTGSLALAPGTNYFWLTYDINATAASNNLIDARFDSVTVAGVNRAPIDGNPTGGSLVSTPLAGAYTIGTGAYLSLASVITDLNNKGISSSVTVNVPAGYIEQAPTGGYLLGSTLLNSNLSSTNKLTFTRNGVGLNPLLFANTGVSTSSDGMFMIQGCDYVTINGIDLIDTNTVSATTEMEQGYGLVKLNGMAPFDGCQFDTIKNCSVTLNRLNANSKGLYIYDATAADAITLLPLVSASDLNSKNGLINNTVQNVNTGIYVVGFTGDIAPYTLWDQSNYVYGNTILNFGGATVGYGVYATAQTGNTISNNTIDNYNNGTNGAVGATTTLYGISNIGTTAGANTANSTINGNTIWLTQNGGSSGTTYGIYDYYAGGVVVVNNNNTKFFTLGTAATTGTYYGAYVYPSSYATSIQYKNNHLDSITYNSSSGSFYGHYVYGTGSSTTDVSGNTILNFTKNLASSGTFYGFTAYGTNVYTAVGSVYNFNNNIADSINLTTNTGSVYVIYDVSGGYTSNVYNNTVSRIYSTVGTGSMFGIYPYYYATNMNIYNNTVSNMYYAGTLYGVYFYGYYFADSKVYNNTFTNMTTTGGSSVAAGFYAYYAGTNTFSMYRNKINSIYSTGTSGSAQGVYIFQSSYQAVANMPVNIYNNTISDLQAPNSSAAPSIMGINFNYSSYTYFGSAYYNTIYLNGTGGANGSSAGIFAGSLTPMTAYNNNIIINKMVHSGTGIAAAIYRNGTSLATYGTSSSNNLLYAGTPSIKNLLYYDGTNKDQTLATFMTRVNPAEASTVSENTTFISTTIGDPYYLMPDTTLPTVVESGAKNITGITNDFTGKIRQGNAGYTSTGTSPDLGAIEGNYVYNDMIAPLITYTVVGNTASTGDRTIIATITDKTGVSIIGSTPTLFYKKTSLGSYVSAIGTKTSGTAQSGTWSFVVSQLSLGGLTLGDSIYYYMAAQDSSSNANLGSLPSGAAGLNVASSTPPATLLSYKIVTPLSGVMTVGTTGTYTSLTNVGGAFEAINNSALSGNVTLQITSDLLESGGIALKKWSENGTGNYTVKIVPNSATERLILDTANNTVANSAVITFDGATRATIDGRFNGSGKFLRLRNRGANGIAIYFKNDATHDTVQYCNLECVTTVTATVVFGTSNVIGGRGNDSNVVIYNNMGDTLGAIAPAGASNTCIYSGGTPGLENDANIVSYNNFYNFGYNAVNLTGSGTGNNWTFYGNNVYQTANRSTGNAYYMFYVTQGYGHIFRKNSIGGAAPDRSGLAINNTSSYWYVFYQTASGSNTIPNVYDSNTVANFNTSYMYPFYVTGGAATFTNNIVGGKQNAWDTIQSTGQFEGFYSSGTGNVIFNNNTVAYATYIGGGTGYFMGIYNASYGAVNTTTNNIIHDLVGNGAGSFPTIMYNAGIVIYNSSTGGAVTVDKNTIYNISNIGGGSSVGLGAYYIYSPASFTRNKVYGISSTGGVAEGIYGPYYNYNSTTYANNLVSLTSANNATGQLVGIQTNSQYSGTTNNYYNNTVFMNGIASSTSNANSYAFYRNGPSQDNIDVRNNIFYNKRSGGTGNNYAVGYTSSNGISPSTINYNLMVVGDTAKLFELTSSTVTGLAAFNDSYTSSANGNWMALTSAVPAQTLFTDTAVANLSIVTTNANSWYANGKGIAIAAVANDFAGTTRSTTIAGGATDIGAYEFTTSTTPPSATASAAPALNGTTNYTFAGRKVASITWGAAGTVPTSVAVVYYTGTTAPSLLASKTQFNSYYSVTPTGGTGYTYGIALSYDSSMFANVSSSAATRVARYQSPSWYLYTTSSANGVTGMLSSGASYGAASLPSNFTGTDNSNALPVSLLSLTANKTNDDVLVSWKTASEQNTALFEIERSFEGSKFEYAGEVKASGNSDKAIKYNFTDAKVFQSNISVVYYRLKMIDNDGSFEYSNTVVVNIDDKEMNSINVYPNPFTADVNLSFVADKADAKATITVINIIGKTVHTEMVNTQAGRNNANINLDGLQSGVYFISVELNGTKTNMKLVKN